MAFPIEIEAVVHVIFHCELYKIWIQYEQYLQYSTVLYYILYKAYLYVQYIIILLYTVL